jgi:TRAP transporter TAXI family solute receptor
MSRRIARTLAACLLLALSAACAPADDAGSSAATGLVTIGSNPAGTHVYAVAAGLAKVLQENGGLRTTIRPFSGSSVYLAMLQRGELALGLNISIDSYLAYAGLPPYENRMDKLRLLGMMFPLPIMYMVRADSGIQRVEDLRGKRVVITFRANAALEQLHTGILATGGLTPDDVESVIVAGLPEAMRMLTEGRADAVPTGLNTALALQVNSTLPGGIRYITMGSNEARLSEIMPGSAPVTIMPREGMVGIVEPTRVAGIDDFLNTSTDVSEDLAYRIIKTIYESWPELRRDYSQMADTPIEAVAPVNIVHPYHEGAVRYYREIGVWTDAHQRNQERLLALSAAP